jgi:hypothetical protein
VTELLGGHYVLEEDKHGHHRSWNPPARKPAVPIPREGP